MNSRASCAVGASASPPSRWVCRAAAAGAPRAAPRGGRPALRRRRHLVHLARTGPGHPGLRRRSSTPSPAPCCSTGASAPISSPWRAPSTPPPARSCPSVTPALREMLGQLEPIPACVQNSRYDILAYNRTYGRLLCDLDAVAPEDRNCMLLSYTERAVARVRRRPRRDEPADGRQVPRLDGRASRRARLEDAAQAAGDGLAGVPRDLGAPRGGRPAAAGPSSSATPRSDCCAWTTPTSGSARRPGPRMVTYVPADEESRERLERLHALALAEA